MLNVYRGIEVKAKIKTSTSINTNADTSPDTNAETIDSISAENKYYANSALCSFSTTGLASLSLTKKHKLFALAP